MEAFGIDFAPFIPLLFPLREFVLECGIGGFVIVWSGFVLLCECVVVDFSTGLDVFPCGLASGSVFWFCTVFERFFDHCMVFIGFVVFNICVLG